MSQCGVRLLYMNIVTFCTRPRGHSAELDHRGPVAGFHISWPVAFDRQHREDPLAGLHYRIRNGKREVVDSPYRCEVCKP